MLDIAIFAVTVFVALITLVVYLYPGRSKPTSVPGLEPTDPKDGNIADIAQAGSMHEFLMELHDKYGKIASFWIGNQLVISIASHELFQQHNGVFDRPHNLFKLFEPLFGSKSMQWANKAEGRMRRNTYEKCYSHTAVQTLYPTFNKFAKEVADKWATIVGDQHIPLQKYMAAFAINSITLSSFGEYFNNDENVFKLWEDYEYVWGEMERRLTGQIPAPESVEEKRFEERRDEVQETCRKMLKYRQNNPQSPDEYLLVDAILESDVPEEQQFCDAIIFLVGGFHSSANSLTWAIYFLASHPDIQEKAYDEIRAVVGDDDIDSDHSAALVFDPDRFSPENVKSRPSLPYVPFGFAGKRKCPAYRYAYAVAVVVLANLLRRFKITLVPGQVVVPCYALVTSPSEEVWIQVEKRES